MLSAVEHRHTMWTNIRNILDNEVPSIIYFITEADTPVYVNTVVHHFGKTLDEREAYRTAVWQLIARKTLTLQYDLSLDIPCST